MTARISVVICVKNEARRIDDCLRSVIAENPDEIIVVDGASSDNTVDLCRKYNVNVIVSQGSNLTRDRQIGIDEALSEYVVLVDADHRLSAGNLRSLVNDLHENGFDCAQSQLKSYKNYSWLNKAEEEMWDLNHNHPGPREMIGVAPAAYKKALFSEVKFDDRITKTIDDTDFVFRLSKIPGVKFGIGQTVILQLHDSTLKSYFKKFKWYGVGDGEFCLKHSERMRSMMFHLFVRYPIYYPVKALAKGKFFAAPYCFVQGLVRGYWALKTICLAQFGNQT